MNIKPIAEGAAKKFFGLETPQDLMRFGFENLAKLKCSMLEKFNIADLGVIKGRNFSILLSEVGLRPKRLAEFKEKGLATLTMMGEEFKHSSSPNSMNTHTIGLAINQPANQHFYKTNPEILVMDSLGNSYPSAKEIHNALIRDFLKPLFPHSPITVTEVPQQIDGSLTCLNWTLANLKTVRENLGRTDILNLLPKSADLNKILEEQLQFLQNNPSRL